MIMLSGMFVVRRTCCSHEACESCDQPRGQSIFGLHSHCTVRLKMLWL
jgi:hypothetical protein